MKKSNLFMQTFWAEHALSALLVALRHFGAIRAELWECLVPVMLSYLVIALGIVFLCIAAACGGKRGESVQREYIYDQLGWKKEGIHGHKER